MRRLLAAFALAAFPLASWGQMGRVELNVSPLEVNLGARAAVQTGLPGVSPISRPVSLSAPSPSTVFAPRLSPKVLPVSRVLPAASPTAPIDGREKLPAPENKDQGWTPRDLDRVFDLSKAPAAHPSDLDQPPAGTGELSADDVAWMRSEMVEGPAPVFSKEGFAYMVEGDAGQAQIMHGALQAGQKGLMASILDVMYLSLVRAVESDKPERSAVAVAAARRYSAVLSAVSADQAIPLSARSLAARTVRLFLNEEVLIEELARSRQARHELGKLEKTARGFLAPQSAAELPSSSGKWSIPDLIPESARVKDAQEMRFPLSLQNISKEIAAAQFKLEKASARYYAAARKGTFSPALVTRLYGELNSQLGRVLDWIPNAYANITRFPMGTLRKPFSSEDKAHLVLRIPNNANLRMAPERGGFLVSAHFETDIQDQEVLKTIKKSIEDYWRGIFELKAGGGAKHFRTVVTLRALAPGETFSEGSLQLVDGKDNVSNVVGDRLTLGRAWSYDTPAHEFGHILGLADEYQETYHPDKRASEYVVPGNLMGSYPNAVVLSRHFKTAYFLLRRHSLAQ